MKRCGEGVILSPHEARLILAALRDALSFLYDHRPDFDKRQQTTKWRRRVHIYARLRARLQEASKES